MRLSRLQRPLPLVFALALAAALASTACSGGGGEPKTQFPAFQRGNQLWVRIHGFQLVDQVYYQQDEALYVVRPSKPESKIAVVDAEVANDRSNTVLMDVDEDGYTLLDKDGKEYKSVNPFKSRELAPSKPRTEPAYTFIWGNFELQNGYGIRAAALFEVPKDAKPAQFRWDTVDTVYVRFTGQ
jgi:hypothetical protein